MTGFPPKGVWLSHLLGNLPSQCPGVFPPGLATLSRNKREACPGRCLVLEAGSGKRLGLSMFSLSAQSPCFLDIPPCSGGLGPSFYSFLFPLGSGDGKQDWSAS